MREFFRIHIKTYLKSLERYRRSLSVGLLIFFFLITSLFPPILLNIFKQIAPLEKMVEKIVQPKPVLAHYQFTPISGNLVTGTEQTITSATAASTEGVNVGSWKGTLADDNFHWVVAGLNPGGVDVQLNIGGVQLNGANKLIIQTEIDLDATVLSTLVQICDWVDSTDVDNAADAQCTTGGWRTLNTKNASQAALALTNTAAVAFQWHIYNGYWSTGTTGGTSINTPLTNFINGSNQIKIRYYSTTATVSQIAIDYLRVYAIIDPIYHPAEFVQDTGGTPVGHYGSAVVIGNTVSAQQTVTGDALYLQVPGTAGAISDFYLKFKNIKTYTGMNTIAVVTDNSCSVSTANLSYKFKIRNFNTSQWEDISSDIQCYTTDIVDYFAKNNVTISNYINGSNEVWIGAYASANSTTNLRIDTLYIQLGTTNTDAADCEISFGSVTAGRIATNPSGHLSDRIQAMTIDANYMYLAGYDSIGYDYEWRIEKRNLSDGELVTAFDSDGIVISDPSAGNGAINAIATTSGAIFVAGYDSATTNNQWRIEKRDITTGALVTAFDDDGIIQYNPASDVDWINAIAVDSSYLYVAGFQDDDTGVWRIHKYDITTGALDAGFGTDGIITETLYAAATDERPQAIKVDADYLYVAGYASTTGTVGWRLEKRNKTTGALCDGVVNCAAGAFDTDGVVESDPSIYNDNLYAMEIDSSYIYLAGYDRNGAGTYGQWRIEKRDIITGALVTAFDADGIITTDVNTGDYDWPTSLAIDSSYLYIAGMTDDDSGAWRVERRNKTTGALDTNFSGDGVAQSEDYGDDRPNAITVNGSNVYIAGYGTGPRDNQWLIEKRDISTGLRVSSGFGAGDCTETRDIDTTSGDRNTWTIQTEDESTDFSHTFYAWDNDGDGVVEEAGSANIGFSVTVPTNAAVTGIFWAGRLMSGAAGTVRFSIKDFSGLTTTYGGRSLIGGSPTVSMYYSDPILTTGVASGGMAGFMTNPEDHIDTVNNKMRLNLNTTVAGASTTNSVNVWDFAMVSLQWTEDLNHPTKTYQFTPISGTLVTGSETTITSASIAATEGTNVGSWKGTLADDGFHWVVAGLNPGGVDVQLNVGGVQLNGANKLIIQTEFDLDATVLSTLVQICDWVDSTSVDNAADAQCTTGGWRTLNTKNAAQTAVALTNTAAVAFQWHVYNGYWSTGTSGGTPISTPLSNFINSSNQVKIRYYSITNTTSQIAIDYLRIYAVIDPVYFPAEFVQNTGGTPAGHYSGAIIMGNTAAAQQGTAGDALYLQVPGTVDAIADFYLKFKNVKTYTGMNTIVVNTDFSCSAATAGLQYRFKIRNFNSGQWEDFVSIIDCSTTDYFSNFAKNNVTIANYINGSNEVWIGVYALSNSTTNLRLDHIYIMLGTTNTDVADCEISFGSNTAGRIAINPSAPGSDRIEVMKIDSSYMYIAGFDSFGIDNEWRLEKRNLSDGELVTAFDTDGIVTTDPSTGADQILAIAATSSAIFVAGYDTAAGAGQWRIEKRDITTGALVTAFDTDGIIQYNPAADIDQITSITADSSYLYVTGFQDDDTGVWRIHKYDITTGALDTGFDTDGIIAETLATTAVDERPQRIKVDADYLYVAGYASTTGSIGWRLEKRNKTTGALCDGAANCAAGAFDTDGIVESDPSVNIDRIYAMTIDSSGIYVAGHDGVISSADGQWRIEKRDIATGALVTAFDTDGIIQVNPAADIDWVTDLTNDDTYLYIAGFVDDDAGAWRIEKRNKTTGALDTNFSSDGIGQSEDGGDDRANAIAVNGSHVYIAGYGTAPGDNQWLVEKRDITTGLRTNDSFSSNDCTGTRNIDTVAGGRNTWNIQTEDESTDFSHTFYALDNDGDAVVEEAGSANIGFSVTVPTNAAVTGIFWAGRHMSGAAGTVRHAIKDFSGLTGTTGGRSLVGSSPTIAMAYTDPITTGGVGSGGAAGYMTNPEDHIDTVSNKMRLNLNTTVDGASTTNSVNVWDFAMVSLQWIETAAPPAGITVSGTVYTNEGVTGIGSGKSVRLKVNGSGDTYTASTTATSSYSISTVTIGATGDVITVFLDNGSEKAVTITRASSISANITGLDLYQNRIIVRHEDSGPTTISDLDKYDSGQDPDILFTATSSTGTLTASSTSEFFVWSGNTFGAWGTDGVGGTTTLVDSDIRGTFTATSSQFIYISGNWDATTTAVFNSASSTVEFISTVATTTIRTNGKSFWNLNFNGSGGVWTFQDAATSTNNLTITQGAATSTYNMTVLGGAVTGNGTLNWTGGTFLVDGTGNFGGTSDWTFYNLTFGDGSGITTTTATSTGTTTISNVLTVSSSQTLNAGEKPWVLSGGGTPFVKTGTFTPATSTFYYTSTADATVTAATYYNLNLSPAGTPTYNLGSGTLVTNNYLTIGNGTNGVTVNADNNDPTLDVNGNFTISTNATFVASQTGTFTVGNNWSNSGTFTHSNGTTTFDATAFGKTIQTGGSPFYNLTFNGSSGGWTFSDNATTANNFTILNGTVTATSTLYVGGNWSATTTGIFQHNNGEVVFFATDSGNTISDGGWPFYLLTFNGSGGDWLYQDSTSTAPATTTVQAGTPTFLNAKTGGVSVTGGTLNVDWYLGLHLVDNDQTTYNIGNATCTVSEATASSTVWKHNGSIWGSPAVSQWTVTQASGSATGTTPQPNSSGAIRIREYKKTSSATTTYKYNATTTAIYFNNYDYYNDFGKYLTSTSSAESSGVDKTIYEGWHRNNISQMNGSQPYSGLNQPPQKGSWYIGMSSDLQFSVDSLSVNLDLYELNNWTATATTILTATTTYINGYSVKSYASNDGRLRLGVTSNYILRWSYANSTPALWNVYCINNPSYCGFGYTTSDNNLGGTGGAERFATSTKYAGFATSTPGDILADSSQAVYGTTTTITYKVSVAADQPNGQYDTTIFYICTVNY